MHKTGIGRELRGGSIACRICSPSFVDKSLRKVLDFCAEYILRLSFPFLPSYQTFFAVSRRLPMIIGFPLTIESRSYLSNIGNHFTLDYYGKPFLYNYI